MKKIIVLIVLVCIFFTGCGKYDQNDIINTLDKNISEKSYNLEGDLEIVNNDEVYNYDIKVNKSFKFQSDWPYNNSQIYLLQSLINDIKADDKREFKEIEKGYIFRTNVNYPNNRKLVKQDITLDKNLKFKKVVVKDENNTPLMTMKFNNVDYSPTFKKNYFDLDTVMDKNKISEKETMKLEDSIYPLVLPSGTKLSNEEKVSKAGGERVILTFEGEKPFLLVEETANVFEEFTIVPTNGEPFILQDSIGVLGENSLNWTSAGIEYYMVSDVLNQNEMIEIASSISSLPTMK